ncbi:sprint [Brachionus plicatilis]|uniref:Sprint n=1 Tax=Brachionus plicatilis TaxID=10195 RepID=A0A3M7QS38_BRAPC|nr:sprint [Brachionus plicatilis]
MSPENEMNRNLKILISEKLLYTKRIWYLPFLDKANICICLKTKPLGNFIVSGSMEADELVLYKSSDKPKVIEHTIHSTDNLWFWLKDDSANKFKSLISLLEYYVISNPKSKKFKLTLPNAIDEANNFKILNSYSLLEQDFWQDNFYYRQFKDSSDRLKKSEIDNRTEKKDAQTLLSLPQSLTSLDKTKSLEIFEKSEVEAEPTVKKRSKRKFQRIFYDPRFNSYPSARPYYSNILKFFKNPKKSSINASTPVDFGTEKLSKISNLINQIQLEKKRKNNEVTRTDSVLNSLTNLSGTLSNSKSSHNFDTLSINSCLSFMDMIDSSKNLIETYSTVPLPLPSRSKIKIENRRTNILTLYSSSQNNEYSEPFDLIESKREAKKCQDNDSAYSSCYQSNMSSPRTNKVKVVSTEEETINDSMESSCSSSAQLTNSEYESVRDVLISSEKDLFKSTITAFDILTERCSELMELFDAENSESKKTRELKRKFSKYQKTKCQVYQQIDPNRLSSFLKRNLSFDLYMKSSSLLSSSISLSSSNILSDRFNSIRNLIVKMSQNEKIIFGKNIQEFIKCTLGLKELNPFLLMSNTRQFMNGIRNYLLKNDSSNSELRDLLEKEQENLGANELIHVDSLIEDCLQSIILQPLKAKIYYLMVDWFISDNSMISIKHGMKFIAELSCGQVCKYLDLEENGLPNEKCLKQVRNYYNRMQCEYAPFIKLKYMIFILDDLIQTVPEWTDFELLDARKLFCLLAYVFSKCRMYAIQIEIEYIWNLVNNNLLSCETFFYLTLVSCVCQSLVKVNVKKCLDYESYLAEVLHERGHKMNKGFVPLKNGVKCKNLVNLISAKFKVLNPSEYGLYVLQDSEFIPVRDEEKVYEFRLDKIRSNLKFNLVYKRKMSNILCSKFL